MQELEKITEKTFILIDNPEKAYFLGLLWADGYIDNHFYTTRITLVDNLEQILESIKSLGKFKLYYHKARKDKNRSNKAKMELAICCVKLGRYLGQKLNYRNKSKDSPSKVLKKIPKKFHHYFWRGFFDGDGCISSWFHTQSQKIVSRITLSGSYNQNWLDLIKLLKKIKVRFLKEQTITNKNHKYSAIRICNKNDMKKFTDYIYKNREIDKIGL